MSNSAGIKIREAIPEDIEMLVEMWIDLFSGETWEPEAQDSIQETFDSDTEITFVSEVQDGSLSGLAVFAIRSDYVEGSGVKPTGYLEAIYVKPEFRKQHVAQGLLEAGEQWCRERGLTKMGSDTDLINTISQQFHVKSGFREISRSVHFIKDL